MSSSSFVSSTLAPHAGAPGVGSWLSRHDVACCDAIPPPELPAAVSGGTAVAPARPPRTFRLGLRQTAIAGSAAALRAAPVPPPSNPAPPTFAPRCEAPNDFAPDDAFGARLLEAPVLDDVIAVTEFVPSAWTPVVPSLDPPSPVNEGADEHERIPMPPGLRADLLPRHVAVIMDGNGRWARKRGMPRVAGHERGVDALRGIVRACRSWGVEYLTVYAFSTENRNRQPAEVEFLMGLFARALTSEIEALDENGVRVRFAGDLAALSPELQRGAAAAERRTRGNSGLQLCIALNYGGRAEIAHAAREIARRVRDGEIDLDSISEDTIERFLYTNGGGDGAPESRTPDPDLVIRSGGERRLSNFLLWQAAYAELYVSESLWPDFGVPQFGEALLWYQGRARRFGLA